MRRLGMRLAQRPRRDRIVQDVPAALPSARQRQPVRCSILTCFSAAMRPIS
jgi:hypothetical protein